MTLWFQHCTVVCCCFPGSLLQIPQHSETQHIRWGIMDLLASTYLQSVCGAELLVMQSSMQVLYLPLNVEQFIHITGQRVVWLEKITGFWLNLHKSIGIVKGSSPKQITVTSTLRAQHPTKPNLRMVINLFQQYHNISLQYSHSDISTLLFMCFPTKNQNWLSGIGFHMNDAIKICYTLIFEILLCMLFEITFNWHTCYLITAWRCL